MKTDTILRITGAVVALALIALAAWFWQIDGQTQAAGLITAGLGLIALVLRSPLERRSGSGGPRPPRAPDVGVPPSAPRPRVSGRRDRRDAMRPPPGAAAVLAIVLVIPSAPALAACSGGSYEPHAIAGTVMRDGSNTAGGVIREVRMDELREVGRAAAPEEASDAIDAAAAAWDDAHEDLLDGQRIAATATNAYVSAALAAAQGLEERETVERAAADALRALNRLGDLLRRHGLPDLPELPEGVATFVSGFVTGGAR